MPVCRGVDAFVHGHGCMCVWISVKKKPKEKRKLTWSLGKVDADTQMCSVCMWTQMSIKKGKKSKKNTYLEISG